MFICLMKVFPITFVCMKIIAKKNCNLHCLIVAYDISLSKYQTGLNIMLEKTAITFPVGKNNELR